LASKYGYLEVVEFLTKHGADLTAGDNDAVKWASHNGHLEIVEFLTENGADITAQDNYAVRWASNNGHLEVVEFLLANGADIKKKSLQNTFTKNVTKGAKCHSADFYKYLAINYF
jgi:ankyrin repeat protein